jgi:hypothetical protein
MCAYCTSHLTCVYRFTSGLELNILAFLEFRLQDSSQDRVCGTLVHLSKADEKNISGKENGVNSITSGHFSGI